MLLTRGESLKSNFYVLLHFWYITIMFLKRNQEKNQMFMSVFCSICQQHMLHWQVEETFNFHPSVSWF